MTEAKLNLRNRYTAAKGTPNGKGQVRLAIGFEPEIFALLKEAAEAQQVSISSLVNGMVGLWLKP